MKVKILPEYCDEPHPDDVLIQVTGTTVCGAEVYILEGYVPQIEYGDVTGHEYLGNIIQCHSDIGLFQAGDRVVIPLDLSQIPKFRTIYGMDGSAAEDYIKVRFDDHSLFKIPHALSEDQILLLADLYPAARMAIDNANIRPGDTVAIWGCGVLGQIAVQYAWLMGAHRVIAIDPDPEKLELAQQVRKTEILDALEWDIPRKLREMTNNKGPDCCIDTVGPSCRDHTLQMIIDSCRSGGNISVPAAYRDHLNAIPIGATLNKKITIKIGKFRLQKNISQILEQIEDGYLDPFFIQILFPQPEEKFYIYDISKGNNSGIYATKGMMT